MIHYGGNIRLEPIDAVPLTILRSWRNDHRIWRYCRQNSLLNKVSHEKWLEKVSLDPNTKMYTIFSTLEICVGVCGLTSIDQTNRNAEFSLYIGPGFQKQGYGKDSLLNLFSHGFNDLNLECIWGESYEFNPARSLFKSLMHEDGCRRNFYYREGGYINAYLYSILKSEWLQKNEFAGFRKQKCFT